MITYGDHQQFPLGSSCLGVTSSVNSIAQYIPNFDINQQQPIKLNVFLSTKEYEKINLLTFGALVSEYYTFGELDQLLASNALFNIEFFVSSIIEEQLIIDILQKHKNKVNNISLILFKYNGILSDKITPFEENITKIELRMLEKLEGLSRMILKLTGLTHLINCNENLYYSQLSNLRYVSL